MTEAGTNRHMSCGEPKGLLEHFIIEFEEYGTQRDVLGTQLSKALG